MYLHDILLACGRSLRDLAHRMHMATLIKQPSGKYTLKFGVMSVRRRMIWNIRGDFGAEVIGSSGSGYAA
jgi:hypothetical protein